MTKTINKDCINHNLQNFGANNIKKSPTSSFLKSITFGCILTTIWMLFDIGSAYAAPFDLDKAGQTMFEPILRALDKWYGAGVFASGLGGALVAAGDMKTRAIGCGVGVGLSMLVYEGAKSGLGM